MAELQYLADHLQPDECRRLVAALHFKSYNKPNALNEAVNKVSEDIPCLRLLIHWNSSKDEGLGETHEMLFRRLQQIGRHDLAEWLGKTVFHQLGEDLKRSLDSPFKDVVSEETESRTSTIAVESREDLNDWLPFDTVCWFIIMLLCLITLGILMHAIFTHCKKSFKKKSRSKRSHYNYEQMQNEVVVSDAESEDKFDIRKKDDAALKLMGI